MSLKSSAAAIATLFMCLTHQAQGAITNSADVGELRTFQDTNTGRVWLDIDNFFNADASVGLTGFQMLAAVQAQGFVIANTSDIQQLLGSLPNPGTNWATYTSVMGVGVPRQLIWGIYDNPTTSETFDWAYAYSGDQEWHFNGGDNGSLIAAGNGSGARDLGIWAYQLAAPVPEPETYSMLLTGLGLMGFVARRRKRA